MRAKFFIESIETPAEYSDARVLRLSAVTSEGGGDNASFWDATPAGSIELWVTNLPALEGMEVGDEYYIDFTKAPQE